MRKFLKWVGIGLGAIVVLVLMAGGVLYFLGSSRVNQTYEVTTANLVLPTDSASLDHGKHLTEIHGCTDCHGADLSGKLFLDIPPFRATASNLTPGQGGVGARYSVEDFDRAIRHGVKPDGRALIVMPSAAFHQMSDRDAAALIAYIKSIPPVDKELPPTEIRLPGMIMAGTVFDPAMEVRTGATQGETPPAEPTAAYGAYLASMTCAYCHGLDLKGIEKPPAGGSPPSPDLTKTAAWSIDQFKQTLRTGVRPDGTTINAEYMPIALTKAMKDVELEALHAYFTSLSGSDTASLE